MSRGRRVSEVEDKWDFYLCRVDDEAASIALDLGLKSVLSKLSEDTLYAIQIAMAEPGPHGMGSASEAELLHRLEDALVKKSTPLGLRHVGRLRNDGYWQVTFMGPSRQDVELRRLATEELSSVERSFELVANEDADWTYYQDFLYPDDERMQWIQDRHVVEALEGQGDPLTSRRRVDHWIYFSEEKSRQAFARIVLAQGFGIVDSAEDAEQSLVLQVHRVDSVDLEAIHEITKSLLELAKQHGADYDGWETSVEKAALTLG